MQDRIEFNQVKGIIIISLFVSFELMSILSNAQTKVSHIGLRAGFGTALLRLNSDIPELNKKLALQSGGQIGLVAGNKIVKASIGLLGYYSSDRKIAGTIDLYKTNASINFYPLAFISKKEFRVQPYFTGTVAYDRFKFYGYYLNNDNGKVNCSSAEAPYLGAIKQINSTIGGGIELRIMERHDFVHFFSEVRFAHNLANSSNNAQFSQTTILNKMQITAGLSFGVIR
jgi:hypothetical protein